MPTPEPAAPRSVADLAPTDVASPDDYVDEATRQADRRDEHVPPRADLPPSPEEEAAAEKAAARQPEGVAEAYDDMARRGADAEGEGRIA